MKLIAQKLGKTDKEDLLVFVRNDGTETKCPMPRQGTLPHDLVHYVVESALPLKHGFLRQVASGAEASFVMQAVHAPASVGIEREAIQVEAIVEALQTQLWSGAFDHESFFLAMRLASAARDQPEYEFGRFDPSFLYGKALQVLEQWTEVPFYQSMQLPFPGGLMAQEFLGNL